jgi:V8-like Glu-specific endopeptidase
MNQKTIKAVTVLTLIIGLAITAAPAYAITGNSHPDGTHTFVGLVVFYQLDGGGNKIPVSVCSGVLLSSTTMITTAHGALTPNVMVCFDQGPIVASMQDGQLHVEGVTSTYEGTVTVNPEFCMSTQGGMGEFMHNDLAIITLVEPVKTSDVSAYGQLPPAGLMEKVHKTDVTLVGYGFEVNQPIMRNYAYAQTLSSNFAWSDEYIRCSANPGNGRGGICMGDSGGPVLLGDTNIVIALNSYATNTNCVGVSYHARLDTQEVLNWIMEVE